MKKAYLLLLLFVIVMVVAFRYAKPITDNPKPAEIKEQEQAAVIQFTDFSSGQLIISPLTIQGKAPGGWYFEASFPVELVDGNGTVLSQGAAQAQGDWMTSELVPFRVTMKFDVPRSEAGILIFKKDNPSGLPEHDESFRVPVKFH